MLLQGSLQSALGGGAGGDGVTAFLTTDINPKFQDTSGPQALATGAWSLSHLLQNGVLVKSPAGHPLTIPPPLLQPLPYPLTTPHPPVTPTTASTTLASLAG